MNLTINTLILFYLSKNQKLSIFRISNRIGISMKIYTGFNTVVIALLQPAKNQHFMSFS